MARSFPKTVMDSMKALRHPRQWLSGALLVGFLVVAIAGALFVYLADEVGEKAWLTRVDWKVAEFFHRHGVPFLVHAFESVTFFGSAPTLAVLGLAVALVLCTLRRWSLLLGWVAALAGTGLLNTTLKGVIRRLRHQLPEPWETESGWSFPSGHVMGSLVAYGFLAYLLTRTHLGGRQGRECLDHCHRRRVPLSDQHLLALVSSDR
jgi:membrane-associated phospholipid phosphatase